MPVVLIAPHSSDPYSEAPVDILAEVVEIPDTDFGPAQPRPSVKREKQVDSYTLQATWKYVHMKKYKKNLIAPKPTSVDEDPKGFVTLTWTVVPMKPKKSHTRKFKIAKWHAQCGSASSLDVTFRLTHGKNVQTLVYTHLCNRRTLARKSPRATTKARRRTGHPRA